MIDFLSLYISSYEVINLMSQVTAWRKRKEVISINENYARYVMNIEKENKKTFEEFGI